MDEEKREEDLLEEDEEDDLVDDVMKDDSSSSDSSDSSDGSESFGSSTAEDAVSKEDTVTGSSSISDSVSTSSSSDDANRVENSGNSHGSTDNSNSHDALEGHDAAHSHEHTASVNQNKPWEARTVEVDSEKKPDDGMGTGAHTGGDGHISIDKDTFWKYVKIVVVIAVLVLGYNYFFAGDKGITGNVIVEEPAGNLPGEVARVEVSIDDDAVKGDVDAPVTIVEFSDYECPFCTRFYTQTYSQIDEQYIKTGKVRLVYRDYPLSFHPNAQKAGEAAECAGEQDKYYEMHDILFEKGASGGVASYKQFAGEIGLNQGDFDNCLDSGAQAAEVQKDFADGGKYGVQGTPAFFVNGKLISGAQPFNVFKEAIEAELA